VLYAAANEDDGNHLRALELLQSLADEPTVTTDHIVLETWFLLRSRVGRHASMRFWQGLRNTPLRIECVTAVDLERGLAIAETWEDQTFDFVDCTSFAVIERMRLRKAATFDRDFAIFRLGPGRREALEVLT